jgi:carbonic anhydrase
MRYRENAEDDETMSDCVHPDNPEATDCSCASAAEMAAKMHVANADNSVSRRGFLRTGLIGSAAAVLAASSLGVPLPSRAVSKTDLSPGAALKALIDGNGRYVDKKLTSFDEDLAELRQNTAEKQVPFAAVLSCADSRVPPELIFDQSIGRLFVTRVAGNVASTDVIASLEYGAAVLGTKVIMVMGHANCGAVSAAISGKAVPGQISALYRYILPAVDQAGPRLAEAIKANARIQARVLAGASTVLNSLAKKNALKIVASYYDIATGRVTLLK